MFTLVVVYLRLVVWGWFGWLACVCCLGVFGFDLFVIRRFTGSLGVILVCV